MSTSVLKSAERRAAGTKTVLLPQGVTASVKGREILVKGPNGSAGKVFERIPVDVVIQGNKVTVTPFTGKKKDVISANTVSSIVRALVHGVTKGYEYKMKVVFAHFPVTVKIKDDTVFVENFMGERSPRLAKILPGCKVSTEGDDIIIKGPSLEQIGQTAANVEQATRVKRKDQRIFLDGVYVYEKKRN
ncbi:MAG: 50S ribosomal protein L6 [Nitrososphaerota archaeon]|jgi:large subunit ribosomal protein L6|nr:50S ribosomal protein L6 [Nitrososphaerota archaeon]MDG6966722.1 50S ribosomal protein L6 [Nitrososphaerota archaeon]MDG6979217.1 50S ribosomal protein L6 [Nitrososphaerota archaeon]MDG7006275.1 50S ribosomal protein L6 [Nitrososphaerota archaeon]MDG7022343.1 50S ribosomal protein L6 [Nitrososphaerota archaeon]